MKKITLIICMFLLNGVFAQTGFTTNLLFVAKLSGDQVVPPLTNTALGESSFMLNSTRDSLCINLSAKGLSGPITGVMIHEGHAGSTGAMVLDLSGFINGNRVSTLLTGSVLNSVFITTLMNGNFYVNLTTANNPGGEIRGQIELESDFPFMASPDGDQLTPPVVTNATGLVTFDLSRSMRSLRIRGGFENLSSTITGVVLERVKVGYPTVIVYDLTSLLSGTYIDATIDPDTFAVDILRDNVFMIVYTMNNPTGEIRGLVQKQRTFSFDARIDGVQMVPPVATSAVGTGMISFNGALDSIWYDFMVSGLSGPVTATQLYTGLPGATGTMSADLAGGISGNRVKGILAGSGVPAGYFQELLMGNAYISIATSANPNGEVRGQLLRFAREGFTFNMDALQEVPATNSTAIGSGIASIDRDADNLHFRMIVSGLTGPVVSAHFHNAPAGQPGLVMFDLTPFFSQTGTEDGAFNYWMRTAGFDSSKVFLFLNDQVYVNVHTAAFSNGEIRGQVTQGSACSASVGINEVSSLAHNFTVYPNPFSTDVVNIQFDGLINGEGSVEVYDISGRMVMMQEMPVHNGLNAVTIPLTVVQGIYTMQLKINNEKQMQMKLIRE